MVWIGSRSEGLAAACRCQGLLGWAERPSKVAVVAAAAAAPPPAAAAAVRIVAMLPQVFRAVRGRGHW
jgi:hypothetical protein